MFGFDIWDANSGPHTSTVGSLLTEPCPQLLCACAFKLKVYAPYPKNQNKLVHVWYACPCGFNAMQPWMLLEEGSVLTEKWEAEIGAAENTAAGLILGYQGQYPLCSQTHCLQHFSEPSVLPLLVFSVMPLQ